MSKFFVDFGKINDEAEKRSGGGNDYINASSFKPEVEFDFRIAPPLPSLNGLYYLKQYSIWINGVNYISPRTFNQPCPILDMVDAVHKSDDVDDTTKALIESDNFNIREDYIIPIFQILPEYDSRNNLKSIEVADDKVKFLRVSWSVITQIAAIMSNRHYQNGTDLGIMDREKGHNLSLSKVVKGKQTRYNLMGWPQPTELPESLYDEIPDLVEITQSRIYTNEYLEGIMLNYFYGDDMPDENLKHKHSNSGTKSTNVELKSSVKTDVAKPVTKVTSTNASKHADIDTQSSSTMSILDRIRAKKQN